MNRHLIVATTVAAVTLAWAPVSYAQTRTITFDAGDPIGGLAVGATLSNQYAGIGVTFTPNAYSGSGGTSGEGWATNTDMTIVDSTGEDVGDLGSPSLVSGNILHSFDGYFNEDGDASFTINFAMPISSISIDFAGVAFNEAANFTAFNGATMLGSVNGGDSADFQLRLSFSAASITRVVVQMGDYGDWQGIDNITFTAAVPEPASWGMMALGVGALLACRRRQRT